MLDNQMRINVVYAGRVQGVGFRATAREIAADFAVTGWVRNQPDGTVLLQAQGTRTRRERRDGRDGGDGGVGGDGGDVGDGGEVARFLAELRAVMGRHIKTEAATQVGLQTGETGFEVRR